MCVQDIDVQCVLQFTLLHAAGCALHRHTSRVIHRLELLTCVSILSWYRAAPEPAWTSTTPDDRGDLRRPADVGISTVRKDKRHGCGATARRAAVDAANRTAASTNERRRTGGSLNLRRPRTRRPRSAHRALDKDERSNARQVPRSCNRYSSDRMDRPLLGSGFSGPTSDGPPRVSFVRTVFCNVSFAVQRVCMQRVR